MKFNLTKIFFTLILFVACAGASFAQGKPAATAKVSGSLIDQKNTPISYATVSLLRAKDSSVVKGALSTDAGAYSLDHVAAGNYVIKATNVGYAKAVSKG